MQAISHQCIDPDSQSDRHTIAKSAFFTAKSTSWNSDATNIPQKQINMKSPFKYLQIFYIIQSVAGNIQSPNYPIFSY